MLKAKLFKILNDSETIDFEIDGDNIFYCQNEIGRNKDNLMIYGEGIQLNNYSKNNEITKICREICDKMKELNNLLEGSDVK